ncbi:MAG: hypothetical protein ACLRZ9_07170 [Eubacterium sp.]
MINNKWMDDPVLSGVSSEKMEILTKILDSSNGMEPKQMLTYFIQESNKASKNGINFTDAETDAILNVLKTDMTPEEIRKIDTIKRMVNMLSKKKGRI